MVTLYLMYHFIPQFRLPVSLNLTSEVPGLNVPDLIPKLQAAFTNTDAISKTLQLSFIDGSPDAVVYQDCGSEGPSICPVLNDHYSIKILPASATSEYAIDDLSLQVPFDHTSSSSVQDLSNSLTKLLLPPATDAYRLRVAQYAPRYRLAFSLLNEDASLGGGATGWEIEEALARESEASLEGWWD